MIKGFKCACGNNRFYAHQVCHHDIIVNEYGIFEESKEIYYSGCPFGPFTCTECGAEYEEME